MEFTQYAIIESFFWTIILSALAYIIGRLLLKIKEAAEVQKELKQLYLIIRPNDRLPTKREKRKMKWACRELTFSQQRQKRREKWTMVATVVYILLFIWVGLLIGASGSQYTRTYFAAIATLQLIIITMAAHVWDKVTVAFIALFAFLLVMAAAVESGSLGQTAMDGTKSNAATDETAALVGKILHDDEDTYYYKHLSEIEEYTDEFGLDLDRLLEDYGYVFESYIIETDRGVEFAQRPTGYCYWTSFKNETTDSTITIHSLGVKIICCSPDVQLVLMPIESMNPVVNACIHEQEVKVTRDVLALLMEFLERQEKTPRLTVEEPQNI